jgi:hypothetical protein
MGNFWSGNYYPTPEDVQSSYYKRILTVDDFKEAFSREFIKEAKNNRYPDQVHVSIGAIIYCARDVAKERGVKDWALLLRQDNTCADGCPTAERDNIVFDIIVNNCISPPQWRLDSFDKDKSTLVYRAIPVPVVVNHNTRSDKVYEIRAGWPALG